MAARVFIDGESGTTGLGIRERLGDMPELSVISLPKDQRRDIASRRDAMRAADVAILCLPDDAAREAVQLAADLGLDAPRLLDASTAHRVSDGWTYGFAELADGQANAIAAASCVANPGCYPTGAIALLRPLVDAGLLPPDHPISINAVSGYSGGGKGMIAAHEADGGPAFELYGLGLEHKHVAELQRYARLTRRPIFVPSVGHFAQGMLVSIPIHLDALPDHVTGADLGASLAERYRFHPHIRVAEPTADGAVEPEGLNDTDDMELRVFANEARGQAVLVARLDNLGKGASGAAVQNLSLMLNLEPAHG